MRALHPVVHDANPNSCAASRVPDVANVDIHARGGAVLSGVVKIPLIRGIPGVVGKVSVVRNQPLCVLARQQRFRRQYRRLFSQRLRDLERLARRVLRKENRRVFCIRRQLNLHCANCGCDRLRVGTGRELHEHLGRQPAARCHAARPARFIKDQVTALHVRTCGIRARACLAYGRRTVAVKDSDLILCHFVGRPSWSVGNRDALRCGGKRSNRECKEKCKTHG